MKIKLPIFAGVALASLLLPTTNLMASDCCPVEGSSVKDVVGDEHHHGSFALQSDEFKEILDPYLEIQEALAGDDLDAAKAAAEKLSEMDSANPLIQDLASSIAKAESIDFARKSFNKLSNNMIAIAKASHKESDNALYLANCPMAFGNMGASWLQAAVPLANPYYGASMLRCGSIEPIE